MSLIRNLQELRIIISDSKGQNKLVPAPSIKILSNVRRNSKLSFGGSIIAMGALLKPTARHANTV